MMTAIENLDKASTEGPLIVWSEYERRGSCAVIGNILPVAVGSCGRDTAFILKDKERHPYLKDVLRMAIQKAGHDDVPIVLKRPSVRVLSTPSSASFACRMVETKDGPEFLPVTDLFCATKKWWRDELSSIPDFALTNDHLWSDALRVLFQRRGAQDETGCCTFVKEGK